MILETIQTPGDVKKFSTKELALLAQEIRALIVGVVSQKGGHLASSLGAVELCIALQYCLETPHDTIVFDVGHQTYAHKILTGRKDAFVNLRMRDGITGFPNSNESVHDSYISGHASTAVSWAQGIAEAKKLKKEQTKTIAVVGDGSLTGGMCFEALNSCGHAHSDVLVVMNHNEMSISPSVGALSRYLTKILSAPAYNRLRSELEKFLEHFSLGQKLSRKARKFEEAVKGLIVPGVFFEELGFRYFGPIDGHNLEVLIPAIKNILSLNGPRLLHIVTTKGKGYSYAERNPEAYHGVGAFDQNKGVVLKDKKESFSVAFAKKLVSLANNDHRIVAITAAMTHGTGLDLFREKFPRRFFDVGIAEAHAVGFASGLAKQGLKPVVAIYSTFLQRSVDQIIHDVALQDLGVVFVLDRAGLVGEDGPTHHGMFDVGYLRMIPSMTCMAPKDKKELEDMLAFALSLEGPVSIRYPKGEAYSLGKREAVKLGKSQILTEGKDFCIVALGAMVKTGLEIVELLKDKGLAGTLINARFIKPLDEEMLRWAGNHFKLIMTLEEANLMCGFGSGVLEFYEKAGLTHDVRILRVGFPDEFIPVGSRTELFELYELDAVSVAKKIQGILKHEMLWQKGK